LIGHKPVREIKRDSPALLLLLLDSTYQCLGGCQIGGIIKQQSPIGEVYCRRVSADKVDEVDRGL
jgi:hypothetical protein